MYKLARFAHRKASEKWSSRSGDGPAQKLPDKPPCRHQITTQSSDSTAAAVAPFKEFESGPCAICKQQEHDAMIYRFKLLGGLILPYILASLDLTIVATSLPFIASYFSTLHFSIRFAIDQTSTERLTPSARQVRPAKLDRHRFHINLDHLHSGLWAAG